MKPKDGNNQHSRTEEKRKAKKKQKSRMERKKKKRGEGISQKKGSSFVYVPAIQS